MRNKIFSCCFLLIMLFSCNEKESNKTYKKGNWRQNNHLRVVAGFSELETMDSLYYTVLADSVGVRYILHLVYYYDSPSEIVIDLPHRIDTIYETSIRRGKLIYKYPN